MANTTQWNDIGHIGRALMRNFKYSETVLKTKHNSKKAVDLEDILNLHNDMSNGGMKLARIIELFDAMPRIKNLEKLVNNIPPHILAETKAKLGI